MEKYIPVFLGSMLKFIAGPTTGAALELSIWETALLTAMGMMASVTLITLAGERLKRLLRKFRSRKKKSVFTKRNRQFVTLWKKYGVIGVSLLTPLIFTPIGGAVLINAVGAPRKQIFFYMTLSSLLWGFVLTSLTFLFVSQVT